MNPQKDRCVVIGRGAAPPFKLKPVSRYKLVTPDSQVAAHANNILPCKIKGKMEHY